MNQHLMTHKLGSYQGCSLCPCVHKLPRNHHIHTILLKSANRGGYTCTLFYLVSKTCFKLKNHNKCSEVQKK